MISPRLFSFAALCGAFLTSALGLSAQTTYTWTGGAGNNVLFEPAGYSNWSPALPGTMNNTINGTNNDIYVFDGTVSATPIPGQPLSLVVAYGNLGGLVFDNTGGLLPASFGIAAYPDNVPTSTRVLKFNTPDTTINRADL